MRRLFRLPFSRDRVRRDVDNELSFHLEGRIEELVAAGMTREEAEREAQRRFGNRELVEAEVAQIDMSVGKRRELGDRFDAILRDARYALRGLTRRPLYTAAIVVTLALAIGANTTIFSVVEAVLLKPFDIPGMSRLVVVRDDFPLMNLRNAAISPTEAIDLFAEKDLFTVSAGLSGDQVTTDVHGENTRVTGAMTMGEFFNLFGVRPLLGRVYRPEDSQPGRPQVIVLSYRFWQQISGDSAIVGRSVLLGDQPFEVIGVLPPSFAFPRSALFWRPMVLDPAAEYMKDRGYLNEMFVGRLKDGITLEGARARLNTIDKRWHEKYVEGYGPGGHLLIAQSFVDYQAGQLKPITLALFGAVVFVLLIACANIASLQLVRASGRAREIAVRAALGAGRAAIARQLIVESGLLAIAGGVAGVALGWAGLRALTQLDLSQFPALRTLRLDGTVLAFTTGTVVLAGIVFGSAPALRAARADVNDALRDSGRGSSSGPGRNRFLRGSVIVQNALTLLLLTGAALTIRSLDRLVSTDPGFVPENVVTFALTFPVNRFPTQDARWNFTRDLDARLAALPGVQAAAFGAGIPFTSGGGSTHYSLPDVPEQQGEPQRHANQAWIYGDYFKATGIQIVRGRAFTAEDYASPQHVVIVDENLVRQSFGSRDPIGARIEHGPSGIIVGVARAVKLRDLTEEPHPTVYHISAQSKYGGNTAIVRSTLPPEQVLSTARSIVKQMDPSIIFYAPKTLSSSIAESLGPRRLATNVLSGFAALSLILALLGIYAVMSYVVSQRTKEIGIRVALGAQREQLAGMVLRDGAVLAASGLAIGGGALLGLGRLLQSLLYGVDVFDPVAIGVGVALLGGITVAACYLPARRAMRVDPVVTLRSE
jgi:putative ABC transport system permease protein